MRGWIGDGKLQVKKLSGGFMQKDLLLGENSI
jgi:hypothetical protein